MPIFCPVKVPSPGFVTTHLIEPLLQAWTDQDVVVYREHQEIINFFERLGRAGSLVTLKGEIAHLKDGWIAARIPMWSSQSGGFITQDSSEPTTFCGIIGTADEKSNFNAAVAVDNDAFKAMYADVVLPTLDNLPDATKRLLS